MTYKIDKLCIFQNTTQTSHQIINSTSYTEVSGSKCNLNNAEQRSMNLFYKFNFQCGQNPASPYSDDHYLIHMKLQSSNDNFSSDINDIPGFKFNIAHDSAYAGSTTGHDYAIMTYTAFMILENFNKKYLRLVARAYDTTNFTGMLHGYTSFDGVSSTYYYDSLLQVVEI